MSSRCLSPLSSSLAAFALACGSDGPAGVPARTLEIVVVTSGEEADADGYTVQIDAQPSRTVGAAEVLQDDDITAGNHTVYVGGVAGNCTVQGANPRTVSVSATGKTTLTIQVVCGARLGSILVGIRTHGPATYPAPYTVALDGVEAAAVDTGRVLLERIPPGEHLVELRRVPSHCAVNGNQWRITVKPVEVASVEFFVECAGLHGILAITTLTFGPQPPDNFVFTVDGKNPRSIAPLAINAVAVSAGSHVVELLQIPPKCQVQEPNPYPVEVPAAGRGQVIFSVQCEPT
jgi:hypothetical protein